MRTFLLLFLLLAGLVTTAAAAPAYRLLGIGRPSAAQRHKYAYMLSGRRIQRHYGGHHAR